MQEKLIGLGYDEAVINKLRRFFFIHILIAVRQIKDPWAGFSFAQKSTMMKDLCGDKLVQGVISEYPYPKNGHEVASICNYGQTQNGTSPFAAGKINQIIIAIPMEKTPIFLVSFCAKIGKANYENKRQINNQKIYTGTGAAMFDIL